MESEKDLARMLIEAEKALQEGRWDEAEQMYRRILAESPGHPEAERNLGRLDTLKRTNEEILKLIQEGEGLLQSGAYPQAYDIFTQALNLGGHAGVLRYHAALEQKRNAARDLMVWQERVQEALKEAAKQRKEGKLGPALQRLEELLQEIPEEVSYQRMADDLRRLREEILGEITAEDLLQQAQEAYRSQDFERAMTLAAAIPENASQYRSAQNILARARDQQERLIQPALAQAEEALQEDRWADAFAVLDNLRQEYPENPAWQRLWLRVGMTHGQKSLDEGRQANTQREFQRARRLFEQAREAFGKVLEVYPTHQVASAARDEAADLARIALDEHQAQMDWQAGRREAARSVLNEALRRIEHARLEGREYVAVEAVVRSMLDTLQKELDRIQEDTRRLEDGERLLRNRDLEGAKRCFREVLDALLPEQKEQAKDGLNRAEEEMRRFEREMERGRKASRPADAVRAFQAAYEIWPSGPQVASALEQALVEAGEAALAEGKEVEALQYFQRALDLNPDNQRARLGREKPGIRAQVEAALEQAQTDVEQLHRQPETRAAGFAAILERLRAMEPQVQPYPDLKARVDSLRQAVEKRRQQWQAYERLRQEAERERRQGNWADAVDRLTRAAGELGDPCPVWLSEQLGLWQAAARAVQLARQVAQDAEQAQATYAQAEMADDFEAVLTTLRPLQTALQRAQEATLQAGGALPPDLSSLSQKVGDLYARSEVARDALRASAREGLIRVREVVRIRGSDPTLEALARRLEDTVRSEVPELLRRADLAIEVGNLDEALEVLSQAAQLKPEDPEIAHRYAQLRRRRQLEERLDDIERSAESQLATNSVADAVRTLEEGLRLLLGSEDFPAEARQILNELLVLVNEAGGLAFGKEEFWPKAQELEQRFGALSPHWAVVRARNIINKWKTRKRDVALQGIISSSTQVGDLASAYRAAFVFLQSHPNDAEAMSQEANVREALVRRTIESVTKRLGRAEEALGEGRFAIARENLESIENEFLGPLREFPGLPEHDEIFPLRGKVEEIRSRIGELESLYERARPFVEAAEEAFVAGKWREAEEELDRIPVDIERLPVLAQRVDSLKARIQQQGAERACQAVREKLTATRTALRLITTGEEMERLLKDLKALPQEVDWERVPREEREAYYQLLDEVREQRETLRARDTWEAQVQEALAKEDYESARQALEKALAATREGEKRVALETRLEEVRRLADRQREREDAMRRGQDAFARKEYEEARTHFLRAAQLGALAEGFLRAARAGALLVSARRSWEQRGDWESAQAEVEDALALAEGVPEAEEILREARRFQRTLEQKRKEWATLQEYLQAARDALTRGDLDEAGAKVGEVLKRNPDHPDARALQEQIGRTRQARSMLAQALEAMEAGRYEDALARVHTILETVLPDWPEAVALQKRITEGLSAHKALLEAESLARGRDFQAARRTLQEAVRMGADPERVRRVQDLIDELEKRWEEETITPIRDLFRDGKYAEALTRSHQALAQTTSSEFQNVLESLQASIVSRWVEKDLGILRQQLEDATTEEALERVVAELDRLAALRPTPPPHLGQEIARLSRQAHARRLEYRLDIARQEAERGEWQAALNRIREIREEAMKLGLGGVAFKADTLEMDIENRRRQEEEAEEQEKRNQLLAAARARLQQATGLSDLEQARKGIQQVLSIPRFQSDREAGELLEQIETSIALFKETQEVLKKSQELVRQRRFSDARSTLLRLSEVSPLLKPRYDEQYQVVQLLWQAEQHQDHENWLDALNGYRQAVERQPGLKPLLEPEMERCRQRLMESVLQQVQRALEATPPQPEQATAILDTAETSGWLTPAFTSTVTRLRDWIASQEHLAEAVQFLTRAEGSDPARALEALQKARQRLPDDRPDTTIRQWEFLARAALAWQKGDLPQAEMELRALEPSFARLDLAIQLRRLIEARHRVERALAITPPQYDEMIGAVHPVIALPDAEPLRDFVRTRLRAQVETARQTGRYADALAAGNALLALFPEDRDARDLVTGLPEEQRQRSSDALARAREAMRTWSLDEAESALRQVELIGAPEHTGQLAELRERLAQMQQTESRLEESLQNVETAMGKGEWRVAIEHLTEAREQAPSHPRVIAVTQSLLDALFREAQTYLNADQFARALDMCNLALQIEAREDIVRMQREVQRTQDARLNEWSRRAQRAMEAWNLTAAIRALEEGETLAPSERKEEFYRLRRLWEQMESMGQTLQQGMEEGWLSLQERDYDAARRAFERTWRAAVEAGLPEFTEARRWRDYTANLAQAIQNVRNEEGFLEVPHLLNAAGSQLLVASGEELPSILGEGNILHERRRQAVYTIYRLRQVAEEIVRTYQQYLTYRQRGDRIGARDALAELNHQKNLFLQLHQTPAAPPDDFTLQAFSEGVRVQPAGIAAEPAPMAPEPAPPPVSPVQEQTGPETGAGAKPEEGGSPPTEPAPGEPPTVPTLPEPQEATPVPPPEPEPLVPGEPLLDWRSALSGFTVPSYDEEEG